MIPRLALVLVALSSPRPVLADSSINVSPATGLMVDRGLTGDPNVMPMRQLQSQSWSFSCNSGQSFSVQGANLLITREGALNQLMSLCMWAKNSK